MKTLIIILILVVISFFSIRSLLKSFKGESKCSSCPSKKTCTSKKKK